MELDGLWTISFKALREQHAGLTVEEELQRGGILVIAGGRVMGGGASYYYTGGCTVIGDRVELDLLAVKYNDLVAGFFGTGAQASIRAQGRLQGDTMELEAVVPGIANASIQLSAQRRERIDLAKI